MRAAGQSLMDPSVVMGYRSTGHPIKFISQQIIHVDHAEVEKATFTPLVFSTTGGMGKEAEKFHKRLAALLVKKG